MKEGQGLLVAGGITVFISLLFILFVVPDENNHMDSPTANVVDVPQHTEIGFLEILEVSSVILSIALLVSGLVLMYLGD